jgi:hypothetical protein
VPVSALLRSSGQARSLLVHSVTGYWIRLPARDVSRLLLATRVGGAPLSAGCLQPHRLGSAGGDRPDDLCRAGTPSSARVARIACADLLPHGAPRRGCFWWLRRVPSPAMTFVDQVYQRADAFLFGRRTYKHFAATEA